MKFPRRAVRKTFALLSLGLSAFAMPDAASAQASRAPYVMFWRQLGGNWSAGPYPVQTETCVHASPRAACNGQNFKGVYSNGQYALFWINGCRQPPITIECEVHPAAPAAK
ncbi:hypothetical protein K9U39_06690 [Rhodoblastus acidophilus]|uniref:Uncharacterized protein n=1 Tax=Candidatus Rhodoblastus alkanivorans TaxID=2954117 RepID=A0ABS9Z8F7_9HYPH|nr:hypothetical protein [Candidatus Rhodoblastus alkanivorans]MCI4680223.1 hypothetical protein [Candidatus Rhodoblastus alkanivorans]MCI4683326.1 hypothetical protein [Candidatus Rhodoblastus alkanivorans]MDI4640639.1 hypothetical protein [Rhodoblastus acidophilus]